jgi:protein-tyrosine kinase
MPDENRRVDLIHRYAERLKQAPEQPPEPPPVHVVPVDTAQVMRAPWPAAGATVPLDVPPAKPTALAAAGHIAVNLTELGLKGFLVPGSGRTALSEEFRNVKRPLIKRALASGRDALRNGNVILVTSARPGEGKTFAAINLALSIASERDLQVMLIDADASNQGVSKVFGIPPGKGLVDLLLDVSLTVSDVLLGTSIPNLSILRSGDAHPDLPELLSSQRMAGLVRDLVALHPNHIVMIDSPPLLASAEPAVLASHAGQTVMVVEHNRTSWRFIDDSLPKIDHCPSISFLMNQVDPMIWGQHFGGDYGYNGNGPGT